jgi:hypothetical protein
MAAGLGFKTFTTGEVLTAADTNGYLMQGILVFATAAARDAAITSPQEGQYAFLKDSDTLVYYSGSAWAPASVATNLLLNSNFAINQRSYVSAANLASGSYGFDRWKSNFTNTTLTFTASTQGQSLTINASGGLQQVIEQGLVPAGTYTLSWTGTATGRVYNSGGTPPSYAASPVTFTADGTANVVVEYTAVSTTKTLSKVQFNAGTNTTWSLATPTLQSELAACQRYYVRIGDTTSNATLSIGTSNSAGTVSVQSLALPVAMRVAPTVLDYANIRLSDGSTGYAISTASLIGGTTLRGNISCATTGMTAFRVTLLDASASGNYVGFSAEL